MDDFYTGFDFKNHLLTHVRPLAGQGGFERWHRQADPEADPEGVREHREAVPEAGAQDSCMVGKVFPHKR